MNIFVQNIWINTQKMLKNEDLQLEVKFFSKNWKRNRENKQRNAKCTSKHSKHKNRSIVFIEKPRNKRTKESSTTTTQARKNRLSGCFKSFGSNIACIINT